MSRVAVLGLGAMGSRMAARLLKTGHHVSVWNRTSERAESLVKVGTRSATTPRDAVRDAEVAIAMVRDDDASRQVWTDPKAGALAGLPAGAVAVESSTLSLDWTRTLARLAAETDVAFLDAPVAGSRLQANAGQLIYLVGGDAHVLQRVYPLFEALGGAIHHAGMTGAGAGIKLAVNALFGIQVAAVAELLAILRRAGLDSAHAMAAAQQVFRATIEHGWGADNLTSIARLYD